MLVQIKRTVPYLTLRAWTKALQRRAKLSAYRGSEFQCPICRVNLRAFKPMWKSYWRDYHGYGHIYPTAAMETFNTAAFSCPKCDAFDRERLTALYLERVFQSYDRSRRYRLIEFAPAWALHKAIKRHPSIEYRTADLMRPDVDDRGVDLTDMRCYADNTFDVFLCSHMLEHIREDGRAMRELRRILKPDGFGIVLVPLVAGLDETQEDPTIETVADRWRLYGSGDHIRQYGKQDFLNRLTAAGFAVDPVGMDFFGREAFRRAGIAENSVLYVVRKH